MDVLFVLILSVNFVCYVQSADKIPCVWCGFGGTVMDSSYKFSISDVPESCEAIVYGSEYFNTEPSAEDTKAITALTKANKIVYIYYSSMNLDNWNDIMNSKDSSQLDKVIDPMIKFLKKNKVTGIILAYLSLLAGEIPDYATKVKSLICKIKSDVPNLKVGLLVSGWMASEFSNPKTFDFKITNDVTDVYIIDTITAEANCTATTTADGGRLPIKSTAKGQVSLDQINTATKSSPMDQSKILINFADFTVQQEGINTKSYSEFCKQTGNEIWCPDTMQMFYDRVKYIKNTFKGILISGLDRDDFDNSCGCGQFSVAKTYIDAWQDKQITCCPKI